MADRVVAVGAPLAVTASDATLSSKAEFLRAVPILAGLPQRLRHTIASRSTIVHLKAGEWLLRQGDPGDSLYVVRSGRLEVVLEDAGAAVARVLTRGSVVGELALLTRSPRSASVRARRDSELLRLASADFAALLSHEPRFALSLMRELGRQLQASRARTPREDPLPATIALVPFDGPFAHDLVSRLRAALEEHGTVALLRHDPESGDEPPGAAALDRAERTHDRVLLLAEDAVEDDEGWSAFCLRQADRVLVVAGGRRPASQPSPRLRGADVVVRGPASAPIASAWSDILGARAIHVVDADGSAERDVRRLARRLAGRSIGVVLSSGGARGFAHIGALGALADAGFVVDRFGGCSMGSLIAALSACGASAEDIADRCREELVRRSPFNDYTLPRVALIRSRKAEAMLERLFGSTLVEELERPLFTVSADLVSSRLVVHRRGSVVYAVGASMSIPGVAPPMRRLGGLLVDGGVLNNLPVDHMAETGEGPIVAIDVIRRLDAPAEGDETALPSITETLARATVLGSVERAERNRDLARLLIAPDVQNVALREWSALDRAVEAGRDAAEQALEAGGAEHLLEGLRVGGR
jgi:NTE family protein